MPAPIAKGIIVTVSVLVAAGVAAYQSPQVQQWLSNSRRKIAVALHNLGDEIQPRDAVREDISMSEEVGEAAEERRRSARAEIMRRAALLESRKTSRDSQLPLNSFDTLVDNDGNLRFAKDEHGSSTANPTANSTGLDIGAVQPLRRGVNPNNVGHTAMDEEALPRLKIPSAATSNHSESIVQLTPTSEQSSQRGLFNPFSDSPVNGQSPVSATPSSHTEGHTVFYAHPHSTSNFSNQQETSDRSRAEMEEFSRGSHYHYEGSSAQSATGSDSQIGPQQWIDSLRVGLDELNPGNISRYGGSSAQSTAGSDVQSDGFHIASDGTLSDLGVQSVGSPTAGNWSEVGSVVSNDDAGHRSLI